MDATILTILSKSQILTAIQGSLIIRRNKQPRPPNPTPQKERKKNKITWGKNNNHNNNNNTNISDMDHIFIKYLTMSSKP